MDFSISLSPIDDEILFRYFFHPSYQRDSRRRTNARHYRSRDLRKFFHRTSNFYFRRVLCDLLIVWLKARHWWCHRSTLVNLRNNEERNSPLSYFRLNSIKRDESFVRMVRSSLLLFFISWKRRIYASNGTRHLYLDSWFHSSNSISVLYRSNFVHQKSIENRVYLSSTQPTPVHVDNLRNESERGHAYFRPRRSPNETA